VLTRAAEQMNPGMGGWDELLVRNIFEESDAEAILKIKVNEDQEDRPAWHYDKKGLFSVKSAYKLAIQTLF